MTKAVKFQLAIQGGGARLADLLIALSVIQKLEEAKKLQITRIAGTSAGALAAAIYACGEGSCQKASIYLEDKAPKAALAILPKGGKWRVWIKILMRVARGRAVCDETKIKTEIELLFQHLLDTEENLTISHLTRRSKFPRKLIFMATDLSTYHARAFSDETMHLVNCLFDSCAIPLAFKGANSLNNPYVDGGLCENLPSEQLSGEQEDEYGSVLAITFSSRTNKKHKLKESRKRGVIDLFINRKTSDFINDLISAAINNSVRRAQVLLPPHSILTLDSDVGVLDFATAFNKTTRSADFAAQKADTEKWLDRNLTIEHSKAHKKIISFTHGNQAAEKLMQNLREWYAESYEHAKRQVVRDITIVTANSLANPMKDPREHLDLIEKEYEFYPLEKPLLALHFQLGFYEQDEAVLFDYANEISATDANGDNVEFQVFPTVKSEPDKDDVVTRYWGYLLLFAHPLQPAKSAKLGRQNSVTVRYKTQYPDVFRRLREGNKDIFIRTIRYKGICEEAVLVINCPDSFALRTNAQTRQSAKSSWQSLSLNENVNKVRLLQGVSPKFNSFVWSVENLTDGGQIRIELSI